MRKKDFTDVTLYGVTSAVKDPRKTIESAEKLLANGVDAIQLRSRELSDRDFVSLGNILREKCRQYEALFIVDNRLDLALVTQADGVHVGPEDLTISQARDWVGHGKLVGASAHSLAQAMDAQKEGADYVSCGPIWATPTKPAYPAVGLDLIKLYQAALRIPFVIIGGINQGNIDQIVETGGTCVAIVRGLFEAEDPAAAAKYFREKILKNWKELNVVTH